MAIRVGLYAAQFAKLLAGMASAIGLAVIHNDCA